MKSFILLLLLGLYFQSFTQSFQLDPYFSIGSGCNQYVSSSAIQTDGKIIIGGSFTTYDGAARNYISRINPDGSNDPSFTIGLGFNSSVRGIQIQTDGKIIVVGDFTAFNGTARNYIARLNTNGSLDVTFNPGTGFSNGSATTIINSVSIQEDGKIVLGGSFLNYNGSPSKNIARVNTDGSLDPTFAIGTGFDYTIFTTSIQADGKLIAGGLFTTYNGSAINQIARLNTNGSLDNTFNPSTSFNNTVTSSVVQADGKIVVGGAFTSFNGSTTNYIARLNSNGTLDGTFTSGAGFSNGAQPALIRTISIQDDGKLIIGGTFTAYNGTSMNRIIRLNTSGQLDPTFLIGSGFANTVFTTIIQTDGKIIAGGTFTAFNGTTVNRIARIESRNVWGRVFFDVNSNCSSEVNEIGIPNYTLTINPGNICVTTGAEGYWWATNLAAGTYTVTIDTTNVGFDISCPISQQFAVTNPTGFTQGPNFGVLSANTCADPDVSIFAPFLRRCFSNQIIYVQACNQFSTVDYNSTYVDVELDTLISVSSSSIPNTPQGNNVYRFQTGTLSPGQCVNFTINTTISCDALLSQTLCMEATIFPALICALDTVPSPPPNTNGGLLTNFPVDCTLPWDQSSLSVDGYCLNDTIYFTITNTGDPVGGDMECYSPLWVTVDGVVTFTDSIMIPGGQTITYSFPGNGQTWILNAEQHPLHPGNSHPNAHVEACGDIGNWTPGLVNQFPQNDADPVVDIYCGLVSGSFDPNDKTGYPLGQTSENLIQPNQQIQYVIRFQNTGTDTAFTVVIRDTLDVDLNIFTVSSGVSSHAYEFRTYGPRVLEWTFENIYLPDSTTNLAGSNGFVTFHVDQVPNLSPGTLIANEAGIYFDFNDPIITNTSAHKIYDGFVEVSSLDELSKQSSLIHVYPNPSNGDVTIELHNSSGSNPYKFIDQQGRIVKKGILTDSKNTIHMDLKSGMYFLQVGDEVLKIQLIN